MRTARMRVALDTAQPASTRALQVSRSRLDWLDGSGPADASLESRQSRQPPLPAPESRLAIFVATRCQAPASIRLRVRRRGQLRRVASGIAHNRQNELRAGRDRTQEVSDHSTRRLARDRRTPAWRGRAIACARRARLRRVVPDCVRLVSTFLSLGTIEQLKIAIRASFHCVSGSARARSSCKSPAAKS